VSDENKGEYYFSEYPIYGEDKYPEEVKEVN
jgi:hypothetical protein